MPVDNTHERHAVVTTFRRAQKSLRNLSSLKKSKFSTLIVFVWIGDQALKRVRQRLGGPGVRAQTEFQKLKVDLGPLYQNI